MNYLNKTKLFVKPGYVYLPMEELMLYTALGSGVAVILFDTIMRQGGMCYYVRPIRPSEELSTPYFAGPSIIGLLNLFKEIGSQKSNLEAHIYGGADNTEASGYIEDLGRKNTYIGLEILKRAGVRLISRDIGSTYGRKVVFNTGTGEIYSAKVDNIRSYDWYPGLTERKER